jgi:predicted metal-dependent hydrolase
MPTRNLIRDIVEASKASVADPTNRTEVNEAGATSALVVCYALGEILDELIERVGKLEQRVGEPVELGSQLDDIRDQIAKVQKSIERGKKPKKSKK